MMPTISRAGVEVRDAGRSELPEVRRVLLGAYREYAEALPPAVFGRYLTDILDVEGRLGTGRVLVASHGGRVVGTVGRDAWIVGRGPTPRRFGHARWMRTRAAEVRTWTT